MLRTKCGGGRTGEEYPNRRRQFGWLPRLAPNSLSSVFGRVPSTFLLFFFLTPSAHSFNLFYSPSALPTYYVRKRPNLTSFFPDFSSIFLF